MIVEPECVAERCSFFHHRESCRERGDRIELACEFGRGPPQVMVKRTNPSPKVFERRGGERGVLASMQRDDHRRRADAWNPGLDAHELGLLRLAEEGVPDGLRRGADSN